MQNENQAEAAKAAKTKGGEAPRAAAGRAANAKSSIWRGRAGFRLDRRRKPECARAEIRHAHRVPRTHATGTFNLQGDAG